jgi:hypothetical protein
MARRHFTISASAIAAFKSCMSQNGVKVTSTTFASLAKLGRSSAKAAAAAKLSRPATAVHNGCMSFTARSLCVR